MPDVRILDPAVVPLRPVENSSQRLLLMGIAAGFALGLVGVVLLDRVDSRVRYPDQVTADLGLPLIGVVPHLNAARNGSGPAEAAPVVEALRGIRLNLLHQWPSEGPLAVTIASPGAGDGKSFIASNLALAFAEAGHRTLIIDGDVRRGSLHRVMNASRTPGLTNLIKGSVSVREAIQPSSFPNLDFISCGTRTAAAPELLGSDAMAAIFHGLRSSYAVIVVDTPPLAAGVDGFGLATLTGNLLMVLRVGSTNRQLAGAKLEVLDRLPVRILGGILNDVREGSAQSYYRYHSYYLPDYDQEEEADVVGQGLLRSGSDTR